MEKNIEHHMETRFMEGLLALCIVGKSEYGASLFEAFMYPILYHVVNTKP